MSELRLPDLEIELGRLTRLVRAAVRVTLAVAVVVALAGVTVALTAGPGAALRAVDVLLGGGR